jgi:hypothetical protein
MTSKKIYLFPVHPANLSVENVLQPFIRYALLRKDLDDPFTLAQEAMV